MRGRSSTLAYLCLAVALICVSLEQRDSLSPSARADEGEPCDGPCTECGCGAEETCNEVGYCETGGGLQTMIRIPAGTFPMGTEDPGILPLPELATECWGPVHEVTLGSFLIDKFEVTNEGFAAFLNEVGLTSPQGEDYSSWDTTKGWCPEVPEPPSLSSHLWFGVVVDEEEAWVMDGFEQYPVALATWAGARDFCQWRGKRLCTEAEWERAAAGPEGSLWPWGDSWPWGDTWPDAPDDIANCAEELGNSLKECSDGFLHIAPVGSFPAGRALGSGCLDMAGNVDEWVWDLFFCDYYSSPVVWENPTGPCEGEYPCPPYELPEHEDRVVRGGMVNHHNDKLRCAARQSSSVTSRHGFRCCL